MLPETPENRPLARISYLRSGRFVNDRRGTLCVIENGSVATYLEVAVLPYVALVTCSSTFRGGVDLEERRDPSNDRSLTAAAMPRK